MYAKIKDGELKYTAPKKVEEDMIELTKEDEKILAKGGIYKDGKIQEKEKSIEQKIREIKNQCKKDILAKYSETDQTNMMARVGEINSLCILDKRDPTEEEKADLESARTMVMWIRERKVKCSEDIIAMTDEVKNKEVAK